MGVVHEAQDTKPDGFVALKFLALLLVQIVVGSDSPGQILGWREKLSAPGFSVAVNPLDTNTVYAEGMPAGSLFVSYTRGDTWQLLGNTGITNIRQILVHPNDTLTIFCATQDLPRALRKSTDGGSTWRTVLAGYSIDGESMGIDPHHADTMYAGDYSGHVYRSLDRGETWSMSGSNGG